MSVSDLTGTYNTRVGILKRSFMISIIICSANAGDLRLVSQNIHETVGIPYEIISFDNSKGQKGICELYNEGKNKANFDVLCFMHEDIQIKTIGWGQRVLDIFDSDPSIGLLGVAGGGYKSLAPSGWYCLEYESESRYFQNLLQGFKLDEKDEIHAYHNPYNEKLSEVICIDGMWMCAPKNTLADKPFDENLLKGFHGYDLDLSLSLYGKYKIVVTYDVLMKHASEGNFNKAWLNEVLKVQKKWSKKLPLSIDELTKQEFFQIEKRVLRNMVEQMLVWEYSFLEIQNMLFSCAKSRKMPLSLFFKGYLHLVQKYFERKD